MTITTIMFGILCAVFGGAIWFIASKIQRTDWHAQAFDILILVVILVIICYAYGRNVDQYIIDQVRMFCERSISAWDSQ